MASHHGGQEQPPPLYSVAIFWEEGFPEIQGFKITRDILQQSLTAFTIQYLSEQELITRLNTDRFDLFINPYGSAFPKRAWPEKLARQGPLGREGRTQD